MSSESVRSIDDFLKYGLESSRDTIQSINKMEKVKNKLLDKSEEAKSLTFAITMLTESYEFQKKNLKPF